MPQVPRFLPISNGLLKNIMSRSTLSFDMSYPVPAGTKNMESGYSNSSPLKGKFLIPLMWCWIAPAVYLIGSGQIYLDCIVSRGPWFILLTGLWKRLVRKRLGKGRTLLSSVSYVFCSPANTLKEIDVYLLLVFFSWFSGFECYSNRTRSPT